MVRIRAFSPIQLKARVLILGSLGDVTYLNVFGQGLVFLNSPDATSDLLDKKGGLYSDKPRFVMAGEL